MCDQVRRPLEAPLSQTVHNPRSRARPLPAALAAPLRARNCCSQADGAGGSSGGGRAASGSWRSCLGEPPGRWLCADLLVAGRRARAPASCHHAQAACKEEGGRAAAREPEASLPAPAPGSWGRVGPLRPGSCNVNAAQVRRWLSACGTAGCLWRLCWALGRG